MPDVVIPADPITVLAAALNDHGVPKVYEYIPTPRPDEDGESWVQLAHAGGRSIRPIHAEPIVAVWAWGATQDDAISLARWVHGVIESLRGQVVAGVTLSRVDVTLPGWFPEPVSGAPRYRLTATLITRGTVD